MTLQLIDLSLEGPEENLALDEALLLEAEAAAAEGRELGYLRFWESSKHFVVLGVSSALKEDADTKHCRKDGIPILRRASGGGTVLQGPGCLNFTLVLPLGYTAGLRDINSSYRMILDPCLDALDLADITMRGSCDLALGDRKFSGNAQKRSRYCLLHQGTLLWDFDLDLIPRYLRRASISILSSTCRSMGPNYVSESRRPGRPPPRRATGGLRPSRRCSKKNTSTASGSNDSKAAQRLTR